MTARERSGDSPDEFIEFTIEGYHGQIATDSCPADIAGAVRHLTDPAAAIETVHWGRNYLYTAFLEGPSGPLAVVVKQFRNQGWRRRIERSIRGSKAERSWSVARELIRCGLETPQPVLLAESEEPEGPSFFVTRKLDDAVEVRYFFRRLNGEGDGGTFPEVDDHWFLERLGELARRIHDAGIWYRDLSMGNVLIKADDGDLQMWLVDFNRARVGRRLGVLRRSRDICRFPVIEREHRAAFLRGYWGTVPRRSAMRWWFYVLSVNGYLFKHAVKNQLRRLRVRRKHAHGGSHHPHLPAPSADAAARDKAVWDHLSDQPHQHAGRWQKMSIRLADAPSHVRSYAAVVRSALPIWRRYRELIAARHQVPTAFRGIGLAVRPWPGDPVAHLEALDDLGVGPVLVRTHPWERDHDDELQLAAALVGRGHEVAFTIPQNRDLVRDRARWRAAVEEIAERFAPYGRHFQVGQAINRSKWGIWTEAEYIDLYLEAAEILRRRPGVEILGPAVIDFEFQSLISLSARRVPGLRFDVLTSLLYVDRRGAPENPQLGLDTEDKVTLLRAVADTGRNTSSRCWITEFNWPLWEGPHSPAGKTVSVDEERQADYLVRYYLLVLGTGLVERAYWWRLVARGYGLVVPDESGKLRRRPSWNALRTVVTMVEGATLIGRPAAPAGSYLYHFDSGDHEVVVGWTVSGSSRALLPRPAATAVSRDGQGRDAPDGCEVELGPSPAYFILTAP